MKTFSKKLDLLLEHIGEYGENVKGTLGAEEIAKAPTVWAIGAAHIVAIFGIAVLHWDIFSVIILFWSETVIVYATAAIKIAVSAVYRQRKGDRASSYSSVAIVILYGLCYIAVSWVILISIAPQAQNSFPVKIPPVFLSFNSFGAAFKESVIGIFAFAISHIVSFAVNFIGRKEYENSDFSAKTHFPARRFGPGMLAILIGASASYATRSALLFIPFIIIKIILDIVAHGKEHKFFKNFKTIS